MRKVAVLLLFFLVVPLSLVAQKSEQQQVADRYAKDLKSRDTRTRVEAAEALGKLNLAEGVEPLAMALKDPEARVRRAAASALWSSSDVAKPAIPALRTALADPDFAVVMRAAGALIAVGEEASTMAVSLRGVLQSGDGVDRFLAARALIGIEPADKLAGPIVDYLRHNEPDPKKKDDRDGRDVNFQAGEKALRQLAQTQDGRIVPQLMARLNESPYLTAPILRSLGDLRSRPDRWIDTLLGSLNSSGPDIREAAVVLLGKQPAAADVKRWAQPVSQLVSDREKGVRVAAIGSLEAVHGLALGAIGPVVHAVQADSDAEVRARAARAVGEIADTSFPIDTAAKAAAAKAALPILTAAIERDPSLDVRTNALKSVDKLQLDAETAAAILAQAAVEQKDRNVRLAALQLLRNRGKEGASAAGKITPLKNDGDELIRRMSGAVLESMTSDNYGTRTNVSTEASADPAIRDRALEVLRENHYEFTESGYFSVLNEVQVEFVKAFLDAGMSPNYQFPRDYHDPALRVVIEAEDGCGSGKRPTPASAKALLKLLLARGADPNIADDRGNSPLMEAAERCDAEVVKILLAAKANMYAVNAMDISAFEFGLLRASEGAEALAAAGFRLSAAKVKDYRRQYANDPKRLELVKKATKVVK